MDNLVMLGSLVGAGIILVGTGIALLIGAKGPHQYIKAAIGLIFLLIGLMCLGNFALKSIHHTEIEYNEAK